MNRGTKNLQRHRASMRATQHRIADPIRAAVAQLGWSRVLRDLQSISHVYVQRHPDQIKWKRLLTSMQQATAYVEELGVEK